MTTDMGMLSKFELLLHCNNNTSVGVFLVAQVKNPSTNTGDTGSIPDLEDPHAVEQRSLCTTTIEPVL